MKLETTKEHEQRVEEQKYFYTMFDEMYSLCAELEEIERERITNALKLASGNQTKAALSLDIGRTALIAKMKKYKLCS